MSERLAYVLSFSTDGAVRDLQKFGSVAERELGKADDRIDRLGQNMQKIGLGAMAFAGIAGAGLFQMAQGAGEAEASMSALEQVVGETVAQNIARWAEDSAQTVGMSSRAAIDAATSFAQLGKIIGLGGQDLERFSVDLTGLAADFGAFKNVSPELVLQDIQSAFAGSTEVMRKYGIFLDDATLKAAYFRETGERVSGTLTAQQKIVAINAELYRQGADMIGQFEREQGQLGTSTAQLKAELQNLADGIGAGVLPMVSGLVGGAADLAGAFGDLSPEVQSTAGAVAGIGVAVVGAAGALSFIIGKVLTARERFTALGSSLRDADGNLTRMGKASRVAGIGMGALSLATVAWSLHADQAAKHAEQLADSVQRLTEMSDEQLEGFAGMLRAYELVRDQSPEQTFSDIADESLAAAIRVRDHARANEEFRAGVEDAGLSVDEMTTIIDEETAAQARAQDATEAATAAVEGHTSATEGAADGLDAATRSYIAQGEAIEATTPSLDSATRSYIAQGRAIEDTEAAAAGYAEMVAENEAAVASHREELERANQIEREAADAILATVTARRAAADSTFAYRDAERAFADELESANAVLADSETTIHEAAEAMDGAAISAGSLADAAVRLATDQAAARGETLSAVGAGDVWRRSMLDQAAAATGPLRSAIITYIGAVEGIPEEELTDIRALIDNGKIAEAERKLNTVSRTRSSQIKVRATGDADSVINHWARDRNATVRVRAERQGGGWYSPGGQIMFADGGTAQHGAMNVAGETGQLEFAGRGIVTGPTVVPPGTKVTGVRDSADMMRTLVGAIHEQTEMMRQQQGGRQQVSAGAIAQAMAHVMSVQSRRSSLRERAYGRGRYAV